MKAEALKIDASKLEAADGRILIRKLNVGERKLASGLVLPEKTSNTDGCLICEVVHVGRGRLLECGVRDEIPLQAGDRIICREFAGSEIKIDGGKYQVVDWKEVLAVVR